MRIYGRGAGNEQGTPEDTTRCIVSVAQHGGFLYAQCSRKRGHGPESLYCKQHGRKAENGNYLYVPEDKDGTK